MERNLSCWFLKNTENKLWWLKSENTYIGDVVASTEIKRFDVGQTLYDVTQTTTQRKDLDTADPSPDETRKQRRIGPP